MKKFLIGGITAGAMLLATSVASAQVVPSATYTGTVGPSGTGEIVVSEDGTSFDFTAFNWGSPCSYLEFGFPDIAIAADGSFSHALSNPFRSVLGSFNDPGKVVGTVQVIDGGCNTSAQSFSLETPVVWPDGVIEHPATGERGQDVYNTTGAQQVRKASVRPGRSARFLVHIENDGTEPDGIDVKGCGSSGGFRVKYVQGGENVTSLVKAGNYQTATVDTGESETMKVQIRAAKNVKAGKRKSCKVTMTHSDTFRGPSPFARTDAVKAAVKVKR